MSAQAEPTGYGDYLQAGANALSGGINAYSSLSQASATSKEARRKRRAKYFLDVMRNNLGSRDETRNTQNSLSNTLADLMAERAAEYRSSLL